MLKRDWRDYADVIFKVPELVPVFEEFDNAEERARVCVHIMQSDPSMTVATAAHIVNVIFYPAGSLMREDELFCSWLHLKCTKWLRDRGLFILYVANHYSNRSNVPVVAWLIVADKESTFSKQPWAIFCNSAAVYDCLMPTGFRLHDYLRMSLQPLNLL